MNEAFAQGLLLSAIGMGMVFAALAALWGLIALIGRGGAWLASRAQRGQQPIAAPAPTITARAVTPAPDDEEMAAISLALLLLHDEAEAEAGLRRRLPPMLTRWVAIGYGRQLHSWQPPRGRHRHPG